MLICHVSILDADIEIVLSTFKVYFRVRRYSFVKAIFICSCVVQATILDFLIRENSFVLTNINITRG